MILAGDIGGTKTNLAFYEESGKKIVCKVKEKFASKDHNGLDEIVKLFIEKNELTVEVACFGISGPVENNHVKATNLPWEVDAKTLSKELKDAPVYLINDLEANAWGIDALTEDEFSTIYQGKLGLKGNRALISAGTGLGEAGLFFDGEKHIPFACEGGHCDFSPRDDREIELLKFLKEQFGHVSYERVLSGQGLHNIYLFLLHYHKTEPSKELKVELESKDPPFVISEHAINKSDDICIEALELFVSFYGSEAGNLALKMMAYGGVYLGGGIAPKLIKQLRTSNFSDAFLNKGRFSHLLQDFSVKVILNDEAALIGSAHAAHSKHLNSK